MSSVDRTKRDDSVNTVLRRACPGACWNHQHIERDMPPLYDILFPISSKGSALYAETNI